MHKRIESDPNDEAAFNDAVCSFKLGDLDGARVALGLLEQKYPDDARVVGEIGFVDYERKLYGEARSRLNRACLLDPNNELWSVGLFLVLWQLGETAAAFDEIRRFLRAHPDAPEFNRLISEMHAEFRDKGWLRDTKDR